MHLGDDFNTAQATAAVRKLIQLTRKEMTKPDISNQQVMIHNHGIEAVSSVLNFVTKYFSTLGFSSIVSVVKFVNYLKFLIENMFFCLFGF